MYGGKNTLYEVLGINRSASAGDIVRAYRKARAEMTATAAPPEQAALVHEAYEVLSDPQRRESYDASLRDSGFLRPRTATVVGPKWGLFAGIALAVVVGLYFLLRPSGRPEASIPQEIVAAVSPAVGRVHSIDMQGRSTPLGHAFAIENGVMVTTCGGFVANAQLVVSFGARKAPAQVVRPTDAKRNVCKLAVRDAGSWPLPLARGEPAQGDKVYAAATHPTGETLIVEGKVTGFVPVEGGRAVEFNVDATSAMSGAPLLDAYGKVVGIIVAPHEFGKGKNVALPVSWVAALRGGTR
jgi:hypothetical protein